MKELNLRTMLRNKLPVIKSKKYMAWLKQKFPFQDLHHILGSSFKTKLNDLLLCPIPHDIHMKIENGIEVAGYSFEETLVISLNCLFEYIKFIEE